MYKLMKIVCTNKFSVQFIKIISHYKKMGYTINAIRQTTCMAVNPIMVDFAFLLN